MKLTRIDIIGKMEKQKIVNWAIQKDFRQDMPILMKRL